MGYTHYFKQHKAASTEQWEQICDSFKQTCLAAIITKPFHIQRETDDSASPTIDPEEIIFNGQAKDGHETMLLSRTGNGFQFCKTAHKPYDKAVVCLLIIANHYAPGVWNIRSDGDAADWQPTLDWLNSVGTTHYTLPNGI